LLTSALQKALKGSVLYHALSKVMDYAVLPAGKMFRPRLVEALGKDLGGVTENHLHLASAIELHHAYTLVHDDLPAMDDDAIRRGKASTHVAFGEWQAILAGDALLIASFEELMKIDSPRLKELHRLFSWSTGAKGLILGQFLDLGAKGAATLSDVVRIHELKTGRLIQVATLGSYFLASPKRDLRSTIEFMRLGQSIGVGFQLLDDLGELAEETISMHEREINPFLTCAESTLSSLESTLKRLQALMAKHRLKHLDEMLQDHFRNVRSTLLKDLDILQKHVKVKDLKDRITSFV
jgi:geranylgeranyl pyrophosphate synthase